MLEDLELIKEMGRFEKFGRRKPTDTGAPFKWLKDKAATVVIERWHKDRTATSSAPPECETNRTKVREHQKTVGYNPKDFPYTT